MNRTPDDLPRTAGHEPRGSNTCGYHNATPETRDKVGGYATQPQQRPALMTEGEYD